MFDHSDVEIHSCDVVYDGFFEMHKLHLSHACFAGGRVEITRELFVRGEAVCVLLYDPAKESVVMIEQFRVGALDHPRSPWLLELVAGIVEQGETCEEVAHREADEEAGATLTELVPITRYLVSPGGTNEWISLYCARVDSAQMGGVHGLETEGEDIRVQVLPCKQVFEMVAEGRIDNAPSIIALQWLQLNRDDLNQRWLT
ncbi:NUDIX domain-containing protein [Pontibacterium sp.]|uniref:NUDIX domain-containing protein n=2 Tax=Pontibacterium sp. TaxID=2036026 RepID=UPI003516382D